MRYTKGLLIVIALIVLVPQMFASSPVKIVDDGMSDLTILTYEIPNKNSFALTIHHASKKYDATDVGFESYAASELQRYLEKMTGVKFQYAEVKTTADLKQYPRYIAIGRLALDLGAQPPKSEFGIDGLVIDAKAERILLAGETPLASYYAVTRLLEEFGCRWYMPGELGEIIPTHKTLTLAPGEIQEVPDLWFRMLVYSGGRDLGATKQEDEQFTVWNLRNRQIGVTVPTGHIWNYVLPKKDYFKKHPQWFAQINGERKPLMLCTTNEEMIAEFIKNYKEMIEKSPDQIFWTLSPDDGISFCECANCTALDPGLKDLTMPNYPQITDRLVIFLNQVVEEIVKDYPDKYFAFHAYVNYSAPPTKVELHPHLFPSITPITFSRYHEMNSSKSEYSRALAHYVEQWAEKSEHIFYYGYSYNLADMLLPYTKEHQVRYDWPFMYQHKLKGVCIESQKSWPNMLPWYYLMARLNLDRDADLDQITNEFYLNFFGAAAPQMQEYLTMLDLGYKNLEWEMGNWWYAHLLFTPDFLSKADSLLTEAVLKADDAIIEKRIQMFVDTLEFAKMALKVRENTNKCDFAAASEIAQEISTFGEEVYARNPESISRFPLHRYVNWYWQGPLGQAKEKLDKSEVIYIFPDSWHAFVDYGHVGEIGRLYEPEQTLTRWIKLNTYSQLISEQGLNHFRGHIWYRQSFELEDCYAGRAIYLLLPGIDDYVKVYLNGASVGGKPGGISRCLDFDLTPYVKFGEENVIVLDVSNLNISELETGGIMRPVLIYTPKNSQK